MSYVERTSLLSALIVDIEEGHKLIWVCGPPASGKTVLCKRALRDRAFIWIDGGQIPTSGSLWDSIARRIDKRATAAEAEITSTDIPELLGAVQRTGTILVLDDFHAMPNLVKQDFVRWLKPVAFLGLTAIITSVEKPEFNDEKIPSDMRQRTSLIEVPSWTGDELRAIGQAGFRALQKRVSDDAIGILAGHSAGSPLAMQRLCSRLARLLAGEVQCGPEPYRLTDEMRCALFGEHEVDRQRLLARNRPAPKPRARKIIDRFWPGKRG